MRFLEENNNLSHHAEQLLTRPKLDQLVSRSAAVCRRRSVCQDLCKHAYAHCIQNVCVFMHKHLLTSAPPLLKHMANIQEISAVIYVWKKPVDSCHDWSESAEGVRPYKVRRWLDASQSPSCTFWQTVQTAAHIWGFPESVDKGVRTRKKSWLVSGWLAPHSLDTARRFGTLELFRLHLHLNTKHSTWFQCDYIKKT